jgi:hypothetical protein
MSVPPVIDAMGYNFIAYFCEEWRMPADGEDLSPSPEDSDVIAELSRGARSGFATELFKSLGVEEFDGTVSGNAGSDCFSISQVIRGVQYLARKLSDEPHLANELEFVVKILVRLNYAKDPSKAIVFIWFC